MQNGKLENKICPLVNYAVRRDTCKPISTAPYASQ